MTKWTHVCPLLGVTLLACATGETEAPNPLGLESAGNNGTAGTAEPTAGSGGSAVGNGGSSEGGTTATAGTMSGGAFTFSGTTSFGGFGTAGTATAGTAAGGASGSGSGGASAGAGGKANGGAGGKANGGAGGMAGAGGGGNAMCAGTTLPAKATWVATASMSLDAAYQPPKVLDGDNGTRWSTGTKMVGGEWLQIDFGAVATVNEITLHTNNGDYFRHYQVRMSNTSQDFAAPILKEADGVTGTIVIPLATAKAGRYLTIRQTGMLAADEIAWWSLHEVNVACK